jgi:hypothetical protein
VNFARTSGARAAGCSSRIDPEHESPQHDIADVTIGDVSAGGAQQVAATGTRPAELIVMIAIAARTLSNTLQSK